MDPHVTAYLADILDDCREPDTGEVSDSIPQLANADRERLAVAIATLDGEVHAAGDHDVPFSIQSVSKVFTYALALEQHGIDAVLEKVDTEPSGDSYNEMSVEEVSGRPRNPMINIGAITTHGLIGTPSMGADERFPIVLEGISAFAGRELEVDEEVYEAEFEAADRNRALGFLAASHGKIEADPLEVVKGYLKQCSILVTAEDLALMAVTLANHGVNPRTGKQVVSAATVRQVLSVMMTCGMYDAAGDWVSSVGLPAKSGVSGSIAVTVPGRLGISVFSPALDESGSSVRGVRVCERLSADLDLHLMSGTSPAPSLAELLP